jgi:hypothetical protein
MGRPRRLAALLALAGGAAAQVASPLAAGGTARGNVTAGSQSFFNISGGACSDGWLTVTMYDLARNGSNTASQAGAQATPLLLMQQGSVPLVNTAANPIQLGPYTLVDSNGAPRPPSLRARRLPLLGCRSGLGPAPASWNRARPPGAHLSL